MAKIDVNEAKKLAKLSRLNFSEDELGKFVLEFEKMLESFSSIEKIDVSGVSLTEDTLKSDGQLRKDELKQSFSQEAILQNAPEKKDGSFVVPITVE